MLGNKSFKIMEENMKEIQLYLEQDEKYSDKQERYFMIPNWLFDEGEYVGLDVYERIALICN